MDIVSQIFLSKSVEKLVFLTDICLKIDRHTDISLAVRREVDFSLRHPRRRSQEPCAPVSLPACRWCSPSSTCPASVSSLCVSCRRHVTSCLVCAALAGGALPALEPGAEVVVPLARAVAGAGSGGSVGTFCGIHTVPAGASARAGLRPLGAGPVRSVCPGASAVRCIRPEPCPQGWSGSVQTQGWHQGMEDGALWRPYI